MKKLYLHIGSHKTGSTSIQFYLYKNKAQLNRFGYRYYSCSPVGEIRKSCNPWVSITDELRFKGAKVKNKYNLADRLGQVDGNVILSAEHFSWIFDYNEINKLHSVLSELFDKIYIVVYIRRQDALAVSHLQQASKATNAPARKFYGDLTQALPEYKPYLDQYLDYNNKIGMWGDAFGDDNIIVRDFARDSLFKGDVVDDFLNILGMSKISKINVNESMGAKSLVANRLFNELGVNKGRKEVLDILIKNDKAKMLPSKHAAKKFYENYKESNRLLNSRFNVSKTSYLFSEDFTMYPEGSEADLSEEILRNLLKEAMDNILRTKGGDEIASKKK